jgi:phage shock protein PspC (stress-responsive transcriptional regulator)
MKKTVNVNIAGQVFTVDEDAYERLDTYLNDVRHRLVQNERDAMDDMEIRVAELFQERVSSQMCVVTMSVVESVIAQLGAPEEFGLCRSDQREARYSNNQRHSERLYRLRKNRLIAGVCGGIAEYLGVDTLVIRLGMFFLVFFCGMSILVYFILWIVLPEKNDGEF